jgi:hypothetical protein
MSFDDLLEAWLAGERPLIPEEHREDLSLALQGYEALQAALEENFYGEGFEDRTPPQLPDDYELIAEIGRGGMGVVYRARQRSLEREVAIKVLRPGEATFGPLLARFADEARHLARLRHPHIVAIHEFGEADGEPYFTMDYVQGEPLSDRLRRGALSPSQAIGIAEQICEAVQFAHEHGVIHRDLKPGNILLSGGEHAFVTDFGLARDLAQPATATRSGELLGTPAYMAREQALGQNDRIGETTDVYGLGAVIYEMLAGRPPYGKDAPAKVLARVIHEEAMPLRSFDRRVPRDLETVVQKALSPQLHRRYPTVKALLEDLRRARDGQPVLARRPGPLLRGAFWLRRHRRAVAAVLLTGAMVGGATWYWRPGETTLQERAAAHAAAGEHEQAVFAWRRCLEDPSVEDRDHVLAAAVLSCQAIEDPERAVDSCRSLLVFDRDASFGSLDDLVVLALLAEVRVAESASEGSASLRELARHRLTKLRDRGGLTSARLTEVDLALQWLSEVTGELPPTPVRPQRLDPRLCPEGYRERATSDELLTAARNPELKRWHRARAAHAAAWQLEGAEETAQAAAAYREALALLIPEFPAYAASDYIPLEGISEAITGPGSTAGPVTRALFGLLDHYFDTNADHRRWLMVQIGAGLRRCAPEEPDPMRGRLSFTTTGVTLPPSTRITITLCLSSLAAKGETGAYVHVGFDAMGRGWLGVADGSYRLEISTINTNANTVEGGDTLHLMTFDTSALPEIVEVRGGTVELPPFRARLRHEVELLQPEPDSLIDPANVVFAWKPVPDAASYELLFDKKVTSFRFANLEQRYRTKATSLRLASEPKLAEHFLKDELDEWTVEAFDRDGVSIGITKKEDGNRPFQLMK